MNTYLSTFISGLEKPVEKLLQSNLRQVHIHLLLDGLVVYKTSEDVYKIKKLKFLNNTFFVLKKFEKLPSNQDAFNYMIKSVYKLDLDNSVRKYLTKVKTFRIIASDENEFVSVDKMLLNEIEDKIRKLRGIKLSVNIYNPQIEFWFSKRRENIGFFLLRLTKNIMNKKLQRGELRPELAYILCSLSNPDKSDIFLDPFSGYGSIPITRAKNFPYNLIFACDIKKEYRDFVRKRIKLKKMKRVIPKVLDALKMKFCKDNFVSKIVTDPPWGLVENINDITSFYSSMMKEFLRVLKPNGIIILLTARKKELEDVLSKYKNSIKLQEKYDILVSGKKAAVYKIIKL